jgi:isopenicillin-N epimerase
MVTITPHSLHRDFLLDPDVVFLNHGSFGACPLPVFEIYQRWQRELERQPVEFLGRRHDDLLAAARSGLAVYLNTDADELVYVPNATTGLNVVAKSLVLQPGDEILGTDHEYGALDRTWAFVCQRTGAHYIRQPIPMPVTTTEEFVEQFWAGVTPRTRVVFLSHITSPTALIFPIAEIIRRARAVGILSIIDGAHAPGQIPVDLTALAPDVYAGNCHKWMCAPKGSGFLYVRREHQALVDPLVISWGWEPSREATSFIKRNEWQGTRDIAAFLSVPAAIEYQTSHDWESIRQACHALASAARQRVADLVGQPPIAPDSADWFAQMITLLLPPCDPDLIKRRMYDEFHVEAPIITLNDRQFIRASFQAYNTPDHLDRLLDALRVLFVTG